MLSLLFCIFPPLEAFGNTNVEILSDLRGLTEQTEEMTGEEGEGRTEDTTVEKGVMERRSWGRGGQEEGRTRTEG